MDTKQIDGRKYRWEEIDGKGMCLVPEALTLVDVKAGGRFTDRNGNCKSTVIEFFAYLADGGHNACFSLIPVGSYIAWSDWPALPKKDFLNQLILRGWKKE